MPDTAKLDDSIVDLQTKLAFQDGLLEQLNEVVTEQQQHIMRLEQAVKKLKTQLETLQTDFHAGEGKESPPPHY